MREPYSSYALNDSAHWSWHHTFIGQTMQHNFRVYVLLDDVFKQNPQLKGIVEIGTGCGALTTYLALWGIRRKIPVTTVDIRVTPEIMFLRRLGVSCVVADVNSQDTITMLECTVSNDPVLFICDGPAKQAEFQKWHQKLQPGSVICAHDFGVEFSHDIAMTQVPDKSKVEPFMQERWNELNAQLAIYKVL